MAECQPSRELVLSALNDHGPKSNREIVEATGLSHSSVYDALALCWRRGLVLRTAQPICEHERVFKERGGLTQTTRPYHLYFHRPEELDLTAIEGDRFVGHDPKHLYARGGGRTSKAQRILISIRAYRDRTFFSTEFADALADEDMKDSFQEG